MASPYNNCVYNSRVELVLIVAVFVDDGLLCSKSKTKINIVLHDMQGIFKMKTNAPSVYVGIHIIQDRLQKLIHIH